MAREWQEPYPWKEEPSYGLLVSAIEGANCALVARDLEGRIVFMNRRALEWVGYEPQEVEGQTAAMFVPEEHRHAIGAEHAKVLAGDVRARLGVFQRKDGRTFPAVSVPQLLRNEAGELIGTISVVVELASVQTAKRWAVPPHGDFADTLQRIARELEEISLVAGVRRAHFVPLDHPELKALSEREREILAEIAAGARVPSIAKKLFISPHTVRNHLKAIYRKLSVSSQGELVERIRRLGQPG
jgi:PAS domain S-box-containing protein